MPSRSRTPPRLLLDPEPRFVFPTRRRGDHLREEGADGGAPPTDPSSSEPPRCPRHLVDEGAKGRAPRTDPLACADREHRPREPRCSWAEVRCRYTEPMPPWPRGSTILRQPRGRGVGCPRAGAPACDPARRAGARTRFRLLCPAASLTLHTTPISRVIHGPVTVLSPTEGLALIDSPSDGGSPRQLPVPEREP